MNQLKLIRQASNANTNPFGRSKQSYPELQVQHIISYEQLSIDSIQQEHQIPSLNGVPPQSSIMNQYNCQDQYIPTQHGGIYKAQHCFDQVNQYHHNSTNVGKLGKLLSCIESVDDADIPKSLIVPILKIQDYQVQSQVQIALPIIHNIQENIMFASKSSNHTDMGTATSTMNHKQSKDAIIQTKNKKKLGYYSYQICMYVNKQPTELPNLSFSNCDSIYSPRAQKPTHRRVATLQEKKGKEHKLNKQNLSKLSLNQSGSSINSVYFQILKNYKPINIKVK